MPSVTYGGAKRPVPRPFSLVCVILEELLDAWRVNNAVNLRLLELCPDETFDLKPGKGKTIRSNWVHLIGVRKSHVEAMLPAAAVPIAKLDWKAASREEIASALATSDEAMAASLARLDVKTNRWTAAKFFGYAVAHEAHHRSQIEIALRLGGHEPPEMAMFGLWDWPEL